MGDRFEWSEVERRSTPVGPTEIEQPINGRWSGVPRKSFFEGKKVFDTVIHPVLAKLSLIGSGIPRSDRMVRAADGYAPEDRLPAQELNGLNVYIETQQALIDSGLYNADEQETVTRALELAKAARLEERSNEQRTAEREGSSPNLLYDPADELTIASGRAPSILTEIRDWNNGGARRQVRHTVATHNYGGQMVLPIRGQPGRYKAGGWDEAVRVRDASGKRLLEETRDVIDENERKAWIFNDATGEMLTRQEMQNYYDAPAQKSDWKDMRVVLNTPMQDATGARTYYYDIFPTQELGLRAVVENVTSRIVRYGNSVPIALVSAWTGETAHHTSYSARVILTGDAMGSDLRDGIDPNNWRHLAAVIVAVTNQEGGSDAPHLYGSDMAEVLNNSKMATGRARWDPVEKAWEVTEAFGRADNSGLGEIDVKELERLMVNYYRNEPTPTEIQNYIDNLEVIE